jgi:hypothetical protein
MDLKDFIQQTIVQISLAMEGANEELKDHGAIVNPRDVSPSQVDKYEIYGFLLKSEESHEYRRPVHLVRFDVAVTATDKEGTKGGIGVVVGGLVLGSQGQSSAEASSHSRLSFAIPVAFPVQARR